MTPSRSLTLIFSVRIFSSHSASLRPHPEERPKAASRRRGRPPRSPRFETHRFSMLLSMRSRIGLESQKLLRISRKYRILLRLRNLQRIHSRDRVSHQPPPLLRLKRRIGSEQTFPGAEKGVPAARGRDLAQRGGGIEHLVVVDRLLLPLGFLSRGIAVRPA